MVAINNLLEKVENSFNRHSVFTDNKFDNHHHHHHYHRLTCYDNCLIYLFPCMCCEKQYVRETIGSFRYRWNNYNDNDRNHSRKESCMQEHLFKHFNSMGHNGFLNKVSITLIDKTDCKNPKKERRLLEENLESLLALWT